VNFFAAPGKSRFLIRLRPSLYICSGACSTTTSGLYFSPVSNGLSDARLSQPASAAPQAASATARTTSFAPGMALPINMPRPPPKKMVALFATLWPLSTSCDGEAPSPSARRSAGHDEAQGRTGPSERDRAAGRLKAESP
jgi:hypothetical protein